MIWLVIVALVAALWALGASQAAYRIARGLKVAQERSEGRELPTLQEEHDAIISVMTGVDEPDSPDEFRCASCLLWWDEPSSFATRVDLEIPFLDSKLPIHVDLCKECLP